MKRVGCWAGIWLASQGLCCAQSWTVTVEEPTGIYRRVEEVAAAPLAELGGFRSGFRVTDARGREAPWQVAGEHLLLPVRVRGGQIARYRIHCCSQNDPQFDTPLVLRTLGENRLELGNQHFLAVVDLQAGALTELYALDAAAQRSLNLVETTPEEASALKDDIHRHQWRPLPPTPVGGANTGWASLGGGGFVSVDVLERGPLRAHVRLRRPGDTWDLVWTHRGRWLRWSASGGFRFAAISASPYMPFDRCAAASEEDWPTGPEPSEPPEHRVEARLWRRPPGGHVVYYHHKADYGALGILPLSGEPAWFGGCSRRMELRSEAPRSEIALTFPAWRGAQTLIEARSVAGELKNPALIRVAADGASAEEVCRPAPRRVTPAQAGTDARPASFQPEALSLDGEWELAWGEKGAGPTSPWRKVRVPGTVHAQILNRPAYFTREAEWISSKEWWYRKNFSVPESFRGARLRLQFDATDYYAEAWLNGSFLGRHEGYVDPYQYTVTGKIRFEQSNQLRVRVWTPVSYYWKHRPYTIKGSYGAVDQKPDKITAVGITRSVRLLAARGPALGELAVDTRLVDEGAEIHLELELDEQPEGHRWQIALAPRNFAETGRRIWHAPAMTRKTRLTLPLQNPRLWWTWDHGVPHLYTLSLRLLDRAGRAVDGRDLVVGIREIEKRGWVFYLNRRRLFIRGTNVYYHLFLSEADRAAYERDFNLLLGMNVNMIRLHGHFSNPEFYELADEKGVLLWQDFLEAWYPHDAAFARRAAALYDNHIRHVRNHPSVALWATSDEEDLENYRVLTKYLAARAFLLDPQRRPVVRSTGRYGDAHLYHGWYGGSIWDYARMSEPFVSELGATDLPARGSLEKFLPGRWPIERFAEDWKFHRLQIPEARQAWGGLSGRSIEEVVLRSQNYTSRLFQIALERARRNKYSTGGILHFFAIDIWPSVTMAAVDFYRTPKKAYHTVARSFQPVLVSLEYDRDRLRVQEEVNWPVWVVNDRWEPLNNLTLRWQVADAGGRVHQEHSLSVAMASDSSQPVARFQWRPPAPGSWIWRAELRRADGRRISENLVELEVTP